MTQIFIFTASASEAREHLRASIQNPLDPVEVVQHFNYDERPAVQCIAVNNLPICLGGITVCALFRHIVQLPPYFTDVSRQHVASNLATALRSNKGVLPWQNFVIHLPMPPKLHYQSLIILHSLLRHFRLKYRRMYIAIPCHTSPELKQNIHFKTI